MSLRSFSLFAALGLGLMVLASQGQPAMAVIPSICTDSFSILYVNPDVCPSPAPGTTAMPIPFPTPTAVAASSNIATLGTHTLTLGAPTPIPTACVNGSILTTNAGALYVCASSAYVQVTIP